MDTISLDTLQKGQHFSVTGSSNVYEVISDFKGQVSCRIACRHTDDAADCIRLWERTKVLPVDQEDHAKHGSWSVLHAEYEWQTRRIKRIRICCYSVWLGIVALALLFGWKIFLLTVLVSVPIFLASLTLNFGVRQAKTLKQADFWGTLLAVICIGGIAFEAWLFGFFGYLPIIP